jgi:hypothetical protein
LISQYLSLVFCLFINITLQNASHFSVSLRLSLYLCEAPFFCWIMCNSILLLLQNSKVGSLLAGLIAGPSTLLSGPGTQHTSLAIYILMRGLSLHFPSPNLQRITSQNQMAHWISVGWEGGSCFPGLLRQQSPSNLSGASC